MCGKARAVLGRGAPKAAKYMGRLAAFFSGASTSSVSLELL